MTICQIMIHDFMHGFGGLGDGYDAYDLEVGINYAANLIKYENLTKEPFHGYDLNQFIDWAKKQLKKCEVIAS